MAVLNEKPFKVYTPFIKFAEYCNEGNLEMAKNIYYKYELTTHPDLRYAFNYACGSGNFSLVKWFLYINPKVIDIFSLYNSCSKGHLSIVKLLYEILKEPYLKTEPDALFYSFNEACAGGHLEVAKFLYSKLILLKDFEKHLYEHNPTLFDMACEFGYLEVAQLLYTIGGVDIHTQNEKAFRLACVSGHLDVAQWLYSLGDVNIHIYDEDAFRWACYNSHLEVAQWLYSLGMIDFKEINHDNTLLLKITSQPIKDWLATLE